MLSHQVDPRRVVCNTGISGPVIAEDSLVHLMRCTKSCSADVHLTCLSPCGELALTALETRKLPGGATEQDITDGLQRLAAFMMSIIALSQWGLGLKPGTEPIVGLLVFPSAIHRLSIWKPSDGNNVPFGLEHNIEHTSDPLMMGWVLERFLRDYEADYHQLKGIDLKYENPGPVLWSPLNYDLEEGLAPLRVTAPTNLGFLFRTNAKNLGQLIEKQGEKARMLLGEEIPTGEGLIAKYLCALLTVPPSAYSEPIRVLVTSIIQAKKNLVLLLKEQEQQLQYLQKLNQENTQMLNHRELLDAEIENSTAYTTQLRMWAEMRDRLLANQADIRKHMAKTQAEIVALMGTGNIKHPYIGILEFPSTAYNYNHPVIVMRDMGVSLADAMNDTAFLRRWRGSPELRRRFGVEVGDSALNLTDISWPGSGLCHNDIKTANIALKDGDSFCLIDFDMADGKVRSRAKRCPVLRGLYGRRDRSRIFSLAQVALVVFELDADPPPDAVDRLQRFWLRNIQSLPTDGEPGPSRPSIPEFDAWLASKGKLVADVFWYSPLAGRKTRHYCLGKLGRAHCRAILDAMLA
jgi:thiamine kinase-like enzyme